MDWRRNLLSDDESVQALIRDAKRIAVLGIRPEAQASRPAHAVPRFLQEEGYEILPVPTHGEGDAPILGQPVARSVAELEGPVDVVEVFLKPEDIDAHLDDLLAARPGAVWFQLGIRNDAAAKRLAQAGIRVVQDRCMKVERLHLRRLGGDPEGATA